MDLEGRIEAYDISNISGTSSVGSMVVFEEGRPAKDKYRKFKIKTVQGSDDVGMMEEVMRRRLRRAQIHPNAWPLPQIMVIDGGEGQVNRVQDVLDELGIQVPIVGIAKGFDRKQDRLVYDKSDPNLSLFVKRGKEVFQKARDEAHRFAVRYHRNLRKKRSFGGK
jgi:excinuclease ABC subunit C